MHLGDFEELVLMAIARMGENAYGAPIRVRLEEAGRRATVGALYVTLDRLERKGLIEGRDGESTPRRGGRAKRYFRLTGAGLAALSQSEATRVKLRDGWQIAGVVT